MTKLIRSKPHKISVSTKIPNLAKFVESAAQKFAAQADGVEYYECSVECLHEDLAKQINEDLNWLHIKLKKAQKYEPTAEIEAFERKLVKGIIELNQYAARFGVICDQFDAIEEHARAIRSAKREWKKLERKLLNRVPRGESNRR